MAGSRGGGGQHTSVREGLANKPHNIDTETDNDNTTSCTLLSTCMPLNWYVSYGQTGDGVLQTTWIIVAVLLVEAADQAGSILSLYLDIIQSFSYAHIFAWVSVIRI